ncbi:hypothetical protein C8R46DRAFT_1223161 [Mycena filopes]|nr:hypothetical protein C8R46DRAFT_1223161 [Mycena filopes]
MALIRGMLWLSMSSWLFAPHDYSFLDDLEMREDLQAKQTPVFPDNLENNEDDPMDGLTVDESNAPDFNLGATALSNPPYIPRKSAPFQNTVYKLLAIWYQHISVFLYPEAHPNHFRQSSKDVIDDLAQMRCIQRQDYSSDVFQKTLKSSGLLARMHEICDLVETSHPDILHSFRCHNRKTSYGEMICRWTPATITEEEYEASRPHEDENYQFSDDDVFDLFRVAVRGVRWRDMMEAWKYGSMTAAGAQQPAGGRKADGYGPYACHCGDTPDDVRALFRHAVVSTHLFRPAFTEEVSTWDSDVLVEISTSIVPSLHSNINTMTSVNEVTRMGKHGDMV